MSERIAIILAAGISSRMKTEEPKVLHKVCGRPMLAYVLDACRAVGVEKIYVVVGYGGDEVRSCFDDAGDIVWVEQAEQKGTAHAVGCCARYLKDFEGGVFVLCGDMPLIRSEVLEQLIGEHKGTGAAATLATAVLDDATGYGRILRGDDGQIVGIMEHNDCSESQLQIKEVNPSYYLFESRVLLDVLPLIKAENAKGEYYLTDAIGLILESGGKVGAVTAVAAEEAMGVNTTEQLRIVAEVMQRRLQEKVMRNEWS